MSVANLSVEKQKKGCVSLYMSFYVFFGAEGGEWSDPCSMKVKLGQKMGESSTALEVYIWWQHLCPDFVLLINSVAFLLINCILFQCDSILNKMFNTSYLPTWFHSKSFTNLKKSKTGFAKGGYHLIICGVKSNCSGFQSGTESNNTALWSYCPTHCHILHSKIIMT